MSHASLRLLSRVDRYVDSVHTFISLQDVSAAGLGRERLTATSAIMTSCGCGKKYDSASLLAGTYGSLMLADSRKCSPLNQQTSYTSSEWPLLYTTGPTGRH